MINLEEISKESAIPIAELMAIESKLRKQYGTVVSPEQLEIYVEKGIKVHSEKYKNLGLNKYFGVVLTLSSPKDGVAKKRQTAVNKYAENASEAIAGGLVQEYKDGMKRFLSKGVVLSKPISEKDIPKFAVYMPDQKAYIVPVDERATWPNGKQNFNYQRPLPLVRFTTNISGLCSLDGTAWEPFEMGFIDCGEHINVPNLTIPQSRLIAFLAKKKSKAGESLVLTYNGKHTKFDPIEGDITQINPDIMTYIENTPLSEIDSVFAAFTDKEKFKTVSVFGQIGSKFQRESSEEKQFPWIQASITDPTRDKPFKLTVHPDMSAQFEEFNLVKIWGTLSEGKVWDKDLKALTDEKEVSMFVTGVYVLSKDEDAPTDSAAPDEGWTD